MLGWRMRVDIWSDVICPWCFLGKRRFERAVAQLPFGDEVEVRWRAYQLDPRAPKEPGDLRTAIERKYGPGAFDGMTRRLTALGVEEGIAYRFDIAQRVNTVDAHRLLEWATTLGATPQDGLVAQDRLQERLFRAYFEEGANVADHATLASLAAVAGLDEEQAREVLASHAFADEVATDLEGALDREITGVPAFVVEDRLLIPGAQDVETLVAILSRAHERFATSVTVAPGVAAGEACAVDDPRC